MEREEEGRWGEGVLRREGGWSEFGWKQIIFIILRAGANKYLRNRYTSFPASFSQDFEWNKILQWFSLLCSLVSSLVPNLCKSLCHEAWAESKMAVNEATCIFQLCTALSNHVRCGGCFDRRMANRAVLKVFITFFTTICAPYPLVFFLSFVFAVTCILSAHEGRAFCVYMESFDHFWSNIWLRTFVIHKWR